MEADGNTSNEKATGGTHFALFFFQAIFTAWLINHYTFQRRTQVEFQVCVLKPMRYCVKSPREGDGSYFDNSIEFFYNHATGTAALISSKVLRFSRPDKVRSDPAF